MATLRNVADLAGVSVSAVSLVLRNVPGARVGEQTRQRIVEAADQLDYRPNFAGRALRAARTDVIALIVPDLTNALFTDLVQSVDEAAYGLGLTPMLARTEMYTENPDALDRLLHEGRVDGILLQPGDVPAREVIQRVVASGLPLMMINASARARRRSGSVLLDDAAGAEVATRHLLAAGHRRIGLLGGLSGSETGRRREAGYRAALKSAGLHPPAHGVTRTGYRMQDGAEGFGQVWRSAQVTALVVSNVNAAVGAMTEARRLGVAVPQEVSIVAIHDSPTADLTWPALTTVRLPLGELGRRAVAGLRRAMDGEIVGPELVTEPAPEVVERSSVTSPP